VLEVTTPNVVTQLINYSLLGRATEPKDILWHMQFTTVPFFISFAQQIILSETFLQNSGAMRIIGLIFFTGCWPGGNG
jgi:hypothetical protein